ncbi:transcription repressor OFP7-like [Senna tora]|uniref:Transcription repressor n=1 Tax=Senna tora TaxID=362788 RepID=A0A834WRN8_9FABA|nr:transcription repressor OFP7-like [Senna tora]
MYQDIDIVENGRIGVVRETNKVGGGAFESEGTSKHGPKSQEENRCYDPELVVSLADNYIFGALPLTLCHAKSYSISCENNSISNTNFPNMAKRFKLKFTMPSFRLCRSKRLSNFPGNPVPAIYRLSPVNPKVIDIAYPNQPAPPPSTPENRCRTGPSNKNRLPYANSPDSVYCESNFCKIGGDKGKKVKSGNRRSTTSGSSKKSNFLVDKDEESESLISCLTSFSDEFYNEQVHEREISTRHVISNRKKVQTQRRRFQGSERGEISTTRKKKTEAPSSSRRSVPRRMAEGKVKESFAVVKRSNDPYEDFKKSMLEMIMEMEMFEENELEQLLQCFLTLNSRDYHGVIARAFMEIWQELICEPDRVDNNESPILSTVQALKREH